MSARRWVALASMLFTSSTLAHPGSHAHGHEAGQAESLLGAFQAGVLHPLTGVDHLLMLLGTGLLAAVALRTLKLPLAALAAMLLGAIGGHHLGGFGGMEQIIIASLVVAGIALLLPHPQRGLAWLMAVLALAHGWAHGVEASPGGFWAFVPGFVLSSALLLVAGYRLGGRLRRHAWVRQLAGGGMIAFAATVLAA